MRLRLAGLARVTAVVAVALFGLAAQSWAQSGLFRSFDSPHIFWMDRFGIRHHVVNGAVLNHFFRGVTLDQISADQMLAIPVGGDITFEARPGDYDARRDRTAVFEGQPRPEHREHGHHRYGYHERPRYVVERQEAPAVVVPGYYDRERFEQESGR